MYNPPSTYALIAARNKDLLSDAPIIYTPDRLRQVGIDLPDYFSQLPLGFIKLYPEDFIVEEITPEGKVCTIERTATTVPDPAQKKEWLKATMVERDASTIGGAALLATALGISQNDISWAGIKDKVAATAQQITIRNPDLAKLQNFYHEDIFLKDFAYVDEKLLYGNLQGNRFTLLVRCQLDQTQKTLFRNRLKEIGETGFYNFYGPQRFTHRLNGHLIGREFFKQNFAEGIKMIMTLPGETESSVARALRAKADRLWGRWAEMLAVFNKIPLYFTNEIGMLQVLARKPENYLGAMMRQKESIRLYCYSYQNYLFNRLLSDTIKTGKEMPATLPLMDDTVITNRWYKPYLKEDGFDIRKKILVPELWFVVVKPRQIKTRLAALGKIKYHFLPEGVLLRFSLPTASYATVFVASLFQLGEGHPPPEWVDLKKYELEKLTSFFI